MTAYLLLFLYPLLGHLLRPRISENAETASWWALGFLWVLIIGFRIEVGCDWDGYLQLYNNFFATGDFGDLTLQHSFWFTLFNWDAGYIFLTWASAKLGLGIYGINIACGTLIVCGLSAFCRKMPAPWLAWLIATPYFLTVVSMGYSRQATALGLFFWSLRFLLDDRRAYFVILVILATLFHKTAFFLLPLGFLPWPLHKSRLLILTLFPVVLAIIFLTPYLFTSYIISSPYHSDGAPIRAAMNALPALLLLLFRNHCRPEHSHPPVVHWMALAGIIGIALVWFATTAIDRLGLYLLPIQVYVWSYLPFAPDIGVRHFRFIATALVASIYAAALIVWLLYAEHRECWLPYQNLLLT